RGSVVHGRCPGLERYLRFAPRTPSRSTGRPFSTPERRVAASESAATAALCNTAFHRRRAVRLHEPFTHVGDVGNAPDALLAGDAAQIRGAVRQPRSRFRWSGWTTPTGTAGALAWWRALLSADAPERRQQHRD